MTIRRPNVLVLMTDQERYPVPYEDEAVARYRRDHLPARARLHAEGVELRRHHIASSVRLPSRTSLFTGQYPTLHGVRNTDGLAKPAVDPAMVWLDPDLVPTMGDWFRAAGYRTEYRGKWHLSHPDLPSGTGHESLRTNDRDGTLRADAVAAYRAANRLGRFGFDGWIGSEPHGPRPDNTGYVRDPLFADQVVDLFDDLAADPDTPWLAVASFVNPHDIVFADPAWGFLSFPDVPDHVPPVPEAPSQADGFEHRPMAHPEYRAAWTGMVMPQPCDESYRRLYLWLHELADRCLGRVLDTLDDSGMADDTIVVFTSDHGELLGAHGGLQQKWHNAFAETVHVPFVVRGPDLGPGSVDALTSHADVLPTVLVLAGLDADALAPRLTETHAETRPLVGRDLSAAIRSRSVVAADPVYFMTHDQISQGMRTTNVVTQEAFEAVHTNPLVESVVVDDGDATWKLTRYHDGADDEPVDQPWEWELHDLRADPEERTNLGTVHPAFPRLRDLLTDVAAERCLEPRLVNP